MTGGNVVAKLDNPYLDFYRAQAVHQRDADTLMTFRGERLQPSRWCTCPEHRRSGSSGFDFVRRYSWAIPDDRAIRAIAAVSPRGVVEIGAGGGYWARMLRQAGVDIVAYDPDPEGGPESEDEKKGWHDGTRWSDVLIGDHTSVIGHPDRTLLMVWPSYGGEWSDQVLDLFAGDTVVYVGEGSSGCTGSDRMHQILGLGDGFGCWCDPDPCTCAPRETARFTETDCVDIPQWWGLHDQLYVCERRSAAASLSSTREA